MEESNERFDHLHSDVKGMRDELAQLMNHVQQISHMINNHQENGTDVEKKEKNSNNASIQHMDNPSDQCIHQENVMSTIKEYFQSTACQGLQYIFGSGHGYARRFLWLIAYLACASVYLYFSSGAVTRYLSYPAVSNIEYHHVEVLDFPSITFCHQNSLKKSYYDKHITNGSLPAFRSPSEFLRQQVRLGNIQLNFTGDVSNLTDGDIFVTMDHRDANLVQKKFWQATQEIDLERVMIEGSHQFDDIVYKGIFNSKSCARYADYGNDLKCNVTSFIHPLRYRYCHTVTFYYNGTLLQTKRRLGDLDRLELILDTQPEEYLDNHTDTEISLSFHSISSFPTDFMPLYADNEYTFKVERTYIKNLPFPHGSTDCMDTKTPDFENPLKYYNYYNRETCRLECQGEAFLRECKCRKIGYPPFAGTILCNDSACIKEQYISECTQCVEACHTLKYSVDYQKKESKLSGLIIIQVTQKEYGYTEISQDIAYPAESLFGEIGGLLGLLIGASILTVVQLVDLILVLCEIGLRYCRKNKRNNMDRESEVEMKDMMDVEVNTIIEMKDKMVTQGHKPQK